VKYLPLVWAALWRHRMETLLTFCALTVAFALFASMIALNAAYEKAITSSPPNRLFMFCAFGCKDGLPLAYRDQIARIPGVVAIGVLADLSGYHQQVSKKVVISLVDEDFKTAWPELPMSETQWKTLQSNQTGLYFTRSAAVRWDVKEGDAFAVITDPGTREDGSNTWFFNVLGVIPDTPDWQQGPPDKIFGNFRYLEESRPRSQRGYALMFRLTVADPAQARPTCRKINARYATSGIPVFCVPVRDDAEELADASVNMRQISLGIAGAGLFMILYLYANAIAESVRERLPEFAVLKTLGYSDRRITVLVFMEAGIPTIVAALAGAGISWVIGVQVTQLAEKGVLNLPHVPVSPAVLGLALASALLITFLSTVFPLRHLKRMEPAAVMAGR
jgi:putative ABC transport system permease protein